MLFVVTRDGKLYKDFLSHHNLTREETKVVKVVSDLGTASSEDSYVVMKPLPRCYDKSILPQLISRNMNNVTRDYTVRYYVR